MPAMLDAKVAPKSRQSGGKPSGNRYALPMRASSHGKAPEKETGLPPDRESLPRPPVDLPYGCRVTFCLTLFGIAMESVVSAKGIVRV